MICWERAPEQNLSVVELSYRAFDEWRLHSRSFTTAAAVGSSTWPGVLERGEPARVATAGVSASFFETLGAAPALGRAFTPDDDLPNAAPVTILSHSVWTTRFGADPSVVGSRIEMDGARTVVGVMPQGFDYPRGTDFWVPVVPVLTGPAGERAANLRGVGVLFVVGRLRSGVTPEMAREELDQLSAQQQKQGIPHFGSQVVVTPFLDHVLGPVRQALWALLAAVIVLLVIGCTNVSGLMLTRVSRRRRDEAVRVALGATRMQVGREWLVETLILSTAGGVAGFAASHWIARAIVVLAPPDIPRLADDGDQHAGRAVQQCDRRCGRGALRSGAGPSGRRVQSRGRTQRCGAGYFRQAGLACALAAPRGADIVDGPPAGGWRARRAELPQSAADQSGLRLRRRRHVECDAA